MSAPNLHLSDEQIAWYADALHEKKVSELPDEIRLHVEECADCRENIFDVFEITEAERAKEGSRPSFNISQKSKGQKIRKATRWKKFIPAVAAILVLAMVSVVFILNRGGEKDLFASYYEPLSGKHISTTVRGGTEEVELKAIGEMFQEQKYGEALTAINSFLENRPETVDLKLYRGICLLENGETESAVSDFAEVAESNSIFKDQAMWYLALSFLKQGKNEAVKVWLQQLQSRGEYKTAETKELLDLLKE